MKITENFTLEELIKTNTALGIDNTPTPEAIENLKNIAIKILQPIRDQFKVPVIVTSGYRSPAYNKAIGGAVGSQHMKGEAVDIDLGNKNGEVFWWIIENLEWDQIIWEKGSAPPNGNPDWIHISLKKHNNRKMVTRAVVKNSRLEYHIMPIN